MTAPVDTKLPYVRPFTYTGPRYRPDAPYRDDLARALTTRRYALDVAELKALGGATGSSRTQQQTETAFFHSAPTYVQFSRAFVRSSRPKRWISASRRGCWATPGWRPETR